ncbi:AraC family transcriptional regulator [Pseudaminobacter salicylatoxidans]|uniref:AraC family transcriptional regulator n=1 Tax=Pseudaminobacter salicylatoxidans TaxID=93369 RepID=A0A316CAZ1_PSESE|nr:AraC family transcriptional regulator [Pseudaminobacter salicylatoxidans]PWJ85227.1 AraC family transcriptional regulator [Pseudaminobacter salicylatoxidans]
MDPVLKALWYVESHFAGEVCLDDIAGVAGVSRFHMSRAFAAATGRSITRYLRGRRLSVAARALAGGAPDILAVALDAGYGSHEAFTRAFREQFGLTPEALRAQRHLDNLELVEPIIMDDTPTAKLEEPRFVDGKPMLIAGLGERYAFDSPNNAIPALWQRFNAYQGSIPGAVPNAWYGICCNFDDSSFEYVSGVEVTDFSEMPKEFSCVRLAAQKYAVFAHRDHVSKIRNTVHAIWRNWLPNSQFEAADAPNFEHYGPEFDGRTGNGGLEIWIPLKA